MRLRATNEPIVLFGEAKAGRRNPAWTAGGHEPAWLEATELVEVTIAPWDLLWEVGRRAVANKSRKAACINGAIKARVIKGEH